MSGKTYNRLKEEAERIKVSGRSLQRYCQEEGFPYIRAGGCLLFDPEMSDAWLAARVHKGRAAELARAA